MNCLHRQNMKYELILFDLDGTLLDTSPGVFNSVRYALKEYGLPSISEDMLSEFVGPPPKTMYMKLFNVNEETALGLAKKHREYGKTKAINEANEYPYIRDTLEMLRFEGYKLGVATLKSQIIAETILDKFNLSRYFDIIVGMDNNESLTKMDTINIACKMLGVNGNILMIGDSVHDYNGALEAGIDFLGVLYGFGFSPYDELRDYEAIGFCENPSQIIETLRKNSITSSRLNNELQN